jgi:hypothetical protein
MDVILWHIYCPINPKDAQLQGMYKKVHRLADIVKKVHRFADIAKFDTG